MISIVALTVGICSLVAILCGGLGAKFFLDKKNAEVWFPTYNKTVMDDEGNFYEDSSARFPHDNTMEGELSLLNADPCYHERDESRCLRF